jgi:hypothetical protein
MKLINEQLVDLQELTSDQLQQTTGGSKDVFDLMDDLREWLQDLINSH